MEDFLMASAETIKRIRLKMGLTQTKFGEKFGVTRGAICNFEKGRGKPSLEIIIKILKIARNNKIKANIDEFSGN